jgi:hypothetical protein
VKIGKLSDWLLAKVVPEHSAQAACPCWYEGTTCLVRKCCTWGASCGTGETCGPWHCNCC